MHRVCLTVILLLAPSCVPFAALRPTPPAVAPADVALAVEVARADVRLARAEWAGDEGVIVAETAAAVADAAVSAAVTERQAVRGELLVAGVELRAIATGGHVHGQEEEGPAGERVAVVAEASTDEPPPVVRSAVVADAARPERAAVVRSTPAPRRAVRSVDVAPPAEAEPAAEPGETWAIPVREPRVTSRFGPRVDPITGELGRMHRGVDFGHPTGTPVYATASGRVLMAGWCDRGTGNCIVIEHENGWRSQYFHLSRVTIRAGTDVEQGAPIGEIGSTGRSTGPHLHFQLGPPGEAYDPEPLFGTPVQ